jgi:hypothetical protein
MGGTIDGQHGDHILLAPPFIATAADLPNRSVWPTRSKLPCASSLENPKTGDRPQFYENGTDHKSAGQDGLKAQIEAALGAINKLRVAKLLI